MAGHVYKKLDLVGSSPKGIDDAIRAAVARASKTMHGLDWFEVTEIRGQIADGAVAHFQVGVKIGFRLDEGSPQAKAANKAAKARGRR
ncbi:MAG: dodecin domain-containing protein [Alphaproteobacteria bacterium]|nr:dodecin domain-containing protein [Alphaproteobacteria bacterium]